MRRSFTVGLGAIGVVALGALVLGIAFADDEEPASTRPGLDDGQSQIIAEPGDSDASDGFGGMPSDLPLDDIRDGVYPGLGDRPIPVEPDGGIGSSPPFMPTDPNGSVSSPPLGKPTEPGPRLSNPGLPPDRGQTPVAPSQPGRLPLPSGGQYVPAPIDGLEVAVLESFPPQYLVRIAAGLPGGCAKAAGYEVSRVGDLIRIDVYNTMPTGNAVCTAIYGMYNLNVSPGGGFEAGKTYTVQVNDKSIKFTAQ